MEITWAMKGFTGVISLYSGPSVGLGGLSFLLGLKFEGSDASASRNKQPRTVLNS